MTLEPADIERITRRKRHAAQCRVLDALGIAYRKRPDGSPAVLREAVGATLGAVPLTQTTRPQVKLMR